MRPADFLAFSPGFPILIEDGLFDLLDNEEEGARTGPFLQMEKLRLREVKPLVQGTQQAINDAQGGIPVYPAAGPPCCLS